MLMSFCSIFNASDIDIVFIHMQKCIRTFFNIYEAFDFMSVAYFVMLLFIDVFLL